MDLVPATLIRIYVYIFVSFIFLWERKLIFKWILWSALPRVLSVITAQWFWILSDTRKKSQKLISFYLIISEFITVVKLLLIKKWSALQYLSSQLRFRYHTNLLYPIISKLSAIKAKLSSAIGRNEIDCCETNMKNIMGF